MFACIYIPNASGDAHAALLDCAAAFSPRVENASAGTVVFDIEGLERLFGSHSEIATKIANGVRTRGLEANVAVASNPDAAICAARGFGGITVLTHGTEAQRLHDLPLAVLSPPLEILETLERWGVRTLGAFAKLPAIEIRARLGHEGVQLHKLACGAVSRPLVPHVERERFVEIMELNYEIRTIEPLTFILSRILDGICTRLRSRNLATHEVHLSLGTYTRVLNLPLPVRNPKLLAKLLILDLEAHPPGVEIRRIEIEAIPAKPRVTQNGLFVPLSPEPEKLELTLARLKAVVGEGNVGSAEILDTHRPDALRMNAFKIDSPPQMRRGGATTTRSASPIGRSLRERLARRGGADQTNNFIEQHHPSRGFHSSRPSAAPIASALPSSTEEGSWLSLRRFRPPLEATIQLRKGTPVWIAFHGVHGPIATAAGPWHISGDWWRPTMWDREEWDIEVIDTLYRIYYDVHMDRWYAEGVYD